VHLLIEEWISMWTMDYCGESTAGAAALFAILADVPTWPEWNAGVERVELNGPFSAGTTATMALPDQSALPVGLAWVEAGRGFEDETEVPGALVRVTHLLEPLGGGGTRITYRCAVEGPDEVGAEIGPAVSADFLDVIAALAARAEQG
jgi:Polyketide cyclase / dehydrase and lipid transport